jgi:TrmH family RNA methyltransferase
MTSDAQAAFLRLLEQSLTAQGRRQSGYFCVEGLRLIERALEEGAALQGVLYAQSWHDKPSERESALLNTLQQRAIPCFPAPNDLLIERVQGRTFGLCLGVLRLPPAFALDALLADPQRACKLLILVDVMDPGNLGALMRTGVASGISALLAWGGTEPYHPKAARTSMGAIFAAPILSLPSDYPLLSKLAQGGIQRIGATVEGGILPDGHAVQARHALFVGSEAHGLSPSIQAALDLRWSIPMAQGVDSFSVNAAAAILLYESNRLNASFSSLARL